MRVRSLSIVMMVACGPEGAATDSGGSASSDSGSIPTTGHPTEGGSAATTSSSFDGTTTLVSAGDVTDDEGAGDDKPDFAIADLPTDQCPLAPRSNAAVGGESPLGQVLATQGWFATQGGGKCPDAYGIVLLPNADDAEAQLEGPVVDGLRVRVDLEGGDGSGVGEFSAVVSHHVGAFFVFTTGTTIIDVTTGPDDPEGRLVGSVVASGDGWDVSGEFAVPWCEILHSGPCGAVVGD